MAHGNAKVVAQRYLTWEHPCARAVTYSTNKFANSRRVDALSKCGQARRALIFGDFKSPAHHCWILWARSYWLLLKIVRGLILDEDSLARTGVHSFVPPPMIALKTPPSGRGPEIEKGKCGTRQALSSGPRLRNIY